MIIIHCHKHSDYDSDDILMMWKTKIVVMVENSVHKFMRLSSVTTKWDTQNIFYKELFCSDDWKLNIKSMWFSSVIAQWGTKKYILTQTF